MLEFLKFILRQLFGLFGFRPKWVLNHEKIHVGGFAKPQFEAVRDAFVANFENGLEREGAAFALYHKGELVVDLWGGYADKTAKRLWEKDTLTVVFSATKMLAAVTLAMLVDQGKLKYEELVTKYWPKFGKHGKENVTVEMLSSHEAGIVVFDYDIPMEDAEDPEKMSEHLEEQRPNWKPKPGVRGYHGLTFGWLVDQVVRRVDPGSRTVGKFIQAEILRGSGLDFYLGLPKEEFYRVARMSQPGGWEQFCALFNSAQIRKGAVLVAKNGGPRSLAIRSLTEPSWMGVFNMNEMLYNNAELLTHQNASVTGVGTARGLAGILNLIVRGKLLSNGLETMKEIFPVRKNFPVDFMLGMDFDHHHGLAHTFSPKGTRQLGSPGYGGQNVKIDLDESLAMAYLNNGLKPYSADEVPSFANLQNAVYACL